MNEKQLTKVIVGVIVVSILIFIARVSLSPLPKNSPRLISRGNFNEENINFASLTTSTPSLIELYVEGGEFAFYPEIIRAPRDKEVKLKFKNVGELSHNFVIRCSNFNYKTPLLKKNETYELQFRTPTRPEICDFYCELHKDYNMKGIFIVE